MCSIDEMLTQLRTNRQNIATQMEVMEQILEKSNNILLQLESEHSKGTPTPVELPNTKPYSFNKETDQTLSKAIELHQQISQMIVISESSNTDLGFADYLQENCQKVNFLSNNVRKLLVIGNVMNKATEKSQQSEISNDDQLWLH